MLDQEVALRQKVLLENVQHMVVVVAEGREKPQQAGGRGRGKTTELASRADECRVFVEGRQERLTVNKLAILY